MRFRLSSPPVTAGVIVGLYGLLGYCLYPYLSHSERSTRVVSFSSVAYGEVLFWHVVAAVVLVLCGLRHEVGHPYRIREAAVLRLPQTRVGNHILWLVLALGVLPVAMLVAAVGPLLIRRDVYRPAWPNAQLFVLGSGTTYLGVVVTATVLALAARGSPLRRSAVAVLLVYILVLGAIETRGVGFAVLALSIAGVFNARGPTWKRAARLVLAATLALASVSVVLYARATGSEHGMVNFLHAATQPSAYQDLLDPVANVFNGFHASGVAMARPEQVSTLDLSESLRVLPHFSDEVRRVDGLYEFGAGFPMPTLGVASASGWLTALVYLAAGGLALRFAGSGVAKVQQQIHTARLVRVAFRWLPSVSAMLYAAFLVQYKPSSVRIPFMISVWFGLLMFSYAFATRVVASRSKLVVPQR